MHRTLVRLGLLALPALAACDLSAPVWDADYFFPVDYPDIQLADYAVAGQIPDADVPFTAPLTPQQQDITGLLEEFLSDRLNTLTVEIITETTTDVTAAATVSIAPTPTGLFLPGQSATVDLAVSPGVDTAVVQVDPELLRDAIALYFQTQGTLRGAPGGTPVTAADRIRVNVNLLVNFQVSTPPTPQ